MAQRRTATQENTVAYMLAATLIVVSIAFGVWWKFFHVDDPLRNVEFTKFGPYQIETQNYSLAATLSIQTTHDDGEWPKRNRGKINVLFENILSATPLEQMRSSTGLSELQDDLRAEVRRTFGSNVVQAVLLTDFLIQPHDYQH